MIENIERDSQGEGSSAIEAKTESDASGSGAGDDDEDLSNCLYRLFCLLPGRSGALLGG